MRPYSTYVNEVEQLVLLVQSRSAHQEIQASVVANLNGRASRELRRLVDQTELRRNGAFFTSTELSTLLLKSIRDSLTPNSKILDPACGAGDLLLACARELSKAQNLSMTLDGWLHQLYGRDLHPEFISAASARLTLAALTMEANVRSKGLELPKPQCGHLRASCGLTDTAVIKNATHIVLNPPFSAVDSPAGCTWAEGKVNLAAVFIDNCLRHATPGTRIAAILPDVLRSGSRYERWRKAVERRAFVDEVSIYGKFDSRTDVDVFLLTLTTGEPHPAGAPTQWLSKTLSSSNVSEHFDVCVGPVVQYRDPHRGPWTPYARAGNTPLWGTVQSIVRKRRWLGKTIKPPFVVVRRTSSPGDPWRSPATLVLGETPVAVDNHLIVLKPRTGGAETCRILMAQLMSSATNDWLNDRIRCRHLTVSAVKELPFEAQRGY